MNHFAETLAASRRLFILRMLVKLRGEANESVILSAARQGGFFQTSRAEIGRDVDHLRDHGLVSEEWFDTVRVVKLTERGEDVAFGRVQVDGVEHSIWRSHDAPQ